MRSCTTPRRKEALPMNKQNNGFFALTLSVIRARVFLSLGLAALIAGAVVLSLLPPLVLERIINRLTQGQSIPLWLALLYFAALALAGLLEAAQNALITVFGQKITHALRLQMCYKLSRLPASYFIDHEPGKTTSRFVNDVDAVDALFNNGIISMVADTCKVLAILWVIFLKSTGLGVLMLLMTPLLFALTRLFQKRMLTAQLENRKAIGKVNNHIPETIRNIRMIHSLHKEHYMEQRYDDYIRESYRATEKSNLYDSLYSPIILFLSAWVVALMMVLAALGGGMQQFFGMSIGTAVAIIAYVEKVFTPLESIGMEIQNIQSAVAGVRRIDAFLQEEERVLPPAKAALSENCPHSEIRFSDVSFGYDPARPILKSLSFSVPKGDYATLTGRTGSGKSTVLRLLLGLYTPKEGEIRICGLSPDAIPDSSRRRLFGYVEQSFSLVSGSIADQITLFDPAVSREQTEAAAQLTGLHQAILALPKGYDTPAAEAAFSQGQLQLLSIARAIAANPRILLLDEITANLDSDTERRVMEALEQASQNRTVLSVSHRLYQKTLSGLLIPIADPGF